MITGRIRFLEHVTVIAESDGLGGSRQGANYAAGETVELPEPSCQRWLRRGKAVRVLEDSPHGLQAETKNAESRDAGTASSADATADSSPMDDSAPVAGTNRRSYRRRAKPDAA